MCIKVDKSHIMNQFNQTDMNNVSTTRVSSYLSYLESENTTVLMVCDETMTKWSVHALEQADVILVVLNFAEKNKEPVGIEHKIIEMKFKTTREVVFLHSHMTKRIENTNQWLKLRRGYHMHFHIR